MTVPHDLSYLDLPERNRAISTSLRVRTAADLMMDLPPEQPWVVEPLLGAGQVLLIVGPPKIGKSFFALDLLLAIGSGRQFLNHPVSKSTVLYLSAEGSETVLDKRLRTVHDLKPGLDYKDYTRLNVVCTEGRLKLDIRSSVETVNRWLDDVDVVAIDPIYRFQSRGDENSHADQRRIQDVIDRWKARGKAIIIVHHTRKPGNIDSGVAEVRGAGWAEYADAVLRITPRKGKVSLSYTLRHAEDPGELPLEKVGPLFQIADSGMTPEAVAKFIRDSGGRIEGRKPFEDHFKSLAGTKTVQLKIKEAEQRRLIRTEKRPGRGQGRIYILSDGHYE